MNIPTNPNPHLFKGVQYFIHDSIYEKTKLALQDLLNTWGAIPCPPPPPPQTSPSTTTRSIRPRFDPTKLTHFITDTLDFPEFSVLLETTGTGKGKQVVAGAGDSAEGGGRGGPKIVSPAWVTRSFDLQALQQPRFYSPDPALIFSGTCICTSELPETDNLTICSGVEALGGQWRRELTREVTHLICVSERGTKYEMAIRFGSELGIAVVLPHWFEESLKLSQLVPLDIYRFPSPPYTTSLRDGSHSSMTKSFADRLTDYWKLKLQQSTTQQPSTSTSSSSSTTTMTIPSSIPNTATHVILGLEHQSMKPSVKKLQDSEQYFKSSNQNSSSSSSSINNLDETTSTSTKESKSGGGKPQIFEGKKVYLASDLGLSRGLEEALKAKIRQGGGECWSFGIDGEQGGTGTGTATGQTTGRGGERDSWATRRVAEKALRSSQIVVVRNREGWEYWLAYDLSLSIGTIPWLYHSFLSSTLSSPLSKILHYPLPSREGVEEFRGKVITVSNYAGPARDYVRTLIEVLGARFEGTMGRSTDYVVSASDTGSKASHARSWSIPLVTHIWLESCILSWALLSPSLHPSYTLSPHANDGTLFTTILGDRGWTREVIERWNEAEERRGEREKARKGVEELEKEERERLVDDDVEIEGGDEEEEGRIVVVEEEERPKGRVKSKSKSTEPVSKVTEDEDKGTKRQKTKSVEPSVVNSKSNGSKMGETSSKTSTIPPASKSKKKPAKEEEDDDDLAMDVDDEVPRPRKPSPKPPREETPRRTESKSKSKPRARSKSTKVSDDKGAESSALSENDDEEGERDGTCSSSSATPPPSAKAISKHFNQIDEHNLVRPGSRRAAAVKGQAALHIAMEDKNKFDQEQKGSAKKGVGIKRRSSQGRESNSPSKMRKTIKADDDEEATERDEADEEEEKPVVPAKKAKSSKRNAAANEDDDVDSAPKKKTKVLNPVNKNLKKATTQDGTTQEGAISSFDNPPRAKPPPTKSNKIKIISTGLGLDKTSSEIKALKPLGAVWTDHCNQATHLVVKGLSRTEKFLCCLPTAPIIVTKGWIDACIEAKKLVDETPYLVRDKKKEAELDDTLEAILARAKKGKILAGRNVYVTKNVSPDVAVMQRIISACGGTVRPNDLIKNHKKIVSDSSALVVSAPADRRDWEKLASEGIPIYTVEAVFVAAMHQLVEKGFTSENRVDPQLLD